MKKETILIIEDNHLILENTAELLRMEGFEVLTADGGNKGIKIATEKYPNLILCDIVMAAPDGFEIITTLKNNPLTSAIPFVFCSARSEKQTINKAMSLGAADYVVKPYTIEQLSEILRKSLQAAPGKPRPM